MARDSKPAFKYRGRSEESVSRRAKQASGAYDSYISGDVLWFKPREGENSIRLLPRGQKEDFDKWGDHWGIDIFIHYGVGPDNGTYLCADKMKGEPCPVCEARHQTTDPDEADQLKPSNRILCWLIDRHDEKAGPKLWSMPLGTSKDISACSQVKGSGEALLIDDPEDGYDVFFDREGEKMRTKYKRVEVSRDTSPLSDDQKTQDRWLMYMEEHPLPEILLFFDSEHVEKVLFGQGESRRDKEESGSGRGRRGGREADADSQEDTGRRGSSRRGREPDPDPEPEPRSGRRGREEPDATEEPDRRGSSRRGREPDPDPEPEPRSGRRGHRDENTDPDPEPEPRSSGRRGRDSDPDPEPESRRGSSRRGREPDPDPEPEPRSGRRGRDEAEAPRVERYRPPADTDAEPDKTPKERLSRLGRRGR